MGGNLERVLYKLNKMQSLEIDGERISYYKPVPIESEEEASYKKSAAYNLELLQEAVDV
jgi:hypothetical protein